MTRFGKLASFRFLLDLWKPAPNAEGIDEKENNILDNERRFAFNPAVGRPGDGGNDEDHEASDGDARI